LVFYLCPSSVRVVATFPATVLFHLLCPVLPFLDTVTISLNSMIQRKHAATSLQVICTWLLSWSNELCFTARQMACFNDTHNWQTIPHRNFSYRYSDLVTKAIDTVPRCLLGDFLAPSSIDACTAGSPPPPPPVLPNPSSGNRRLAYAPCNNSGEPSSLSQAVRPDYSEGSNK